MTLFADLGARFERANRKLFLVGGSVRDMVLGREAKDLDFTTDALPDEIEGILKDWADSVWDVGREFGTIAAKKGDDDIEITTFRFDGPGRKPQVTFTDSLDEDLQRRDFTINAMALQVTADGLDGMNADGTPNGSFGFINRGNLIDPFGGFNHLCDGVLDTPRTPEQSFGDDPLRMLRAARFSAQLDFTVAPRVFSAMETMAARLGDISAERIAAEMDKLLMGANPLAGLLLLHQTGLMNLIVPELSPFINPLRGSDVTTRWAELLRHVDPLQVRSRLHALKFSNDRVTDVTNLVAHIQRFEFERANMGEWTQEMGRHVLAAAGPQLDRLVRLLDDSALDRVIEALLATEGHPEPFMGGKDVMDLLNLKPGPRVGAALQWLWALRLEKGLMDFDDVAAALFDWDKVSA